MQFSGSPKPLKTLYRNWGNSPWPLQDAFFWQILVLARFNAINAGPKTRIRVLPLHRKSFKNESYLYKTAPRSKLNFLPHRSAWAGPQFSSQPCTRSKTRKPFIETDAIAPSYLNIKFFDGNLNGAIHLQFLRGRNFSGNDTGLSKILHCMTDHRGWPDGVSDTTPVCPQIDLKTVGTAVFGKHVYSWPKRRSRMQFMSFARNIETINCQLTRIWQGDMWLLT